MKLIKYLLAIGLMCGVLFAGALPAKAKLTPYIKSTGDEIMLTHGHPYLGGSRSPGDSIGMTGLEYQANGGCEKRIYVDDSFQVHVNWMKLPPGASSNSSRRMQWNFRFNTGTYFGEVDASVFGAGYGSLDLTQDSVVANQRTIISYHYNGGANAYYPFIDIDVGNGWGAFPNDPKYPPGSNRNIWSMVAAAKNGNIILVTGDYDVSRHHCFVTTDNGTTWTNPFNSDSAATASMFVMASRMSNKVAYVETRYITDTVAAGEIDNNVWFRMSTDGGVTWGPQFNITKYQPADTFRAYCCVSCIFDQNDKLHVVWAGRYVNQGNYYISSKILHWDEVHKVVSVVSKGTDIYNGGWWGWTHPNGCGILRLPADEPLMTVNRTTGVLYTVWCGQADTADISLGGYPNGDIYSAYSLDGGLTWSMWTNLTDTHTPGAPAGACEDEDYIAVCPYTLRDSVFITYIEDKDAGAVSWNEGDTTDNPVRLLVFHEGLINAGESARAKPPSVSMRIMPNPAHGLMQISYYLPSSEIVNIRLYGIDGRLVMLIDLGNKSAGSHGALIDTHELAGGTYFVVLETPGKRISEKLVVVR